MRAHASFQVTAIQDAGLLFQHTTAPSPHDDASTKISGNAAIIETGLDPTGGGIRIYDYGTASFIACTISENEASGASAGGLYVASGSSFHMSSTVFAANRAVGFPDGEGAAIYFASSKRSTLSGVTFVGHTVYDINC